MCAHVTIVTWDELLAVARALRTFTPINDMPDWPARQPHYVDAFPKALVPVLLSAISSKDFGEEGAQWINGVPISSTASAEKLAHVSLDRAGEYATELLAQPAQLTWGYALEGKRDVIFNTRIETAAHSPLWRNSFENRHCIVPVHSFFEPHKTERVHRVNGKELKQVYRFEEPTSPVMLLAGIWDQNRFSILTTEPNAYVSPVHPRMPVILDQRAAIQWLTFEGLHANEDIPLISQALYDGIPQNPTTSHQLSLF